MKTKFLVLAMIASNISFYSYADKEIDFITIKTKGDRHETTTEPKASYDDENNAVEMAIEAEESFCMKVIDSTGRVVYTCPVIMVDGTPANYLLPQLPPGIYTLKVESNTTIYEGNLFIE